LFTAPAPFLSLCVNKTQCERTESAALTRLASATIAELIKNASDGVLLIIGHEASNSPSCRKLLNSAKDDETAVNTLPISICMNNDWLHAIPRLENMEVPLSNGRLIILVGPASKYFDMACIKSKLQNDMNEAHNTNRLVVVTRGAIMLPLGLQEQNILGADAEKVLEAILDSVDCCGGGSWGHGSGTKSKLLSTEFKHLPTTLDWLQISKDMKLPSPMTSLEKALSAKHWKTKSNDNEFTQLDSFVEFIKFSNTLKITVPILRVVNYYDFGSQVSLIQHFIADAGISMLTDRDGLEMSREASIGSTMSKMYQVCNVEPWVSTRGVYNFYIGDGAARLNTAMETAFHLMENSSNSTGFVTLFILNNDKWAIEDNLIAKTEEEHALHSTNFYDTIAVHSNVIKTSSLNDLHATLQTITRQQNAYAKGDIGAKIQIVIVRSLDLDSEIMSPIEGMDSMIRASPEMDLMRKTLGDFAANCEMKVPVYGCSAFEYIQHLNFFLDKTPEGKSYQYCCGRTDIQAAHMCGYDQPEGRCVLFVNDVYGINSLGEAIKMVLSGLGSDSKQLLIFVWHPSLTKVIDHFQLHRPSMVWPSMGPTLAKFYVRKESDGLFINFHTKNVDNIRAQVSKAFEAKTPLVLINMIPSHEENHVSESNNNNGMRVCA